jgi:hypothetical protein
MAGLKDVPETRRIFVQTNVPDVSAHVFLFAYRRFFPCWSTFEVECGRQRTDKWNGRDVHEPNKIIHSEKRLDDSRGRRRENLDHDTKYNQHDICRPSTIRIIPICCYCCYYCLFHLCLWIDPKTIHINYHE